MRDAPSSATPNKDRLGRRRRRYWGALLFLLLGLAAYEGFAHGRGHGHGVQGATRPSKGEAISARRLPRNGPLTILTASPADGVATVETVGHGQSKILWRCPLDVWCGGIVSHDWAPDGKRLAVTLDELARDDSYPLALHVINVESGRDVQIPRRPGPAADETRVALGCWPPTDLDWSPDGTRLAYRCSSDFFWPGKRPDDQINVIEVNGSGFRTIPTHGAAFWPSWSLDGTRIAYSSALGLKGHAAVYAVDLDGSHRRLLATDATAPAWSPDGTRIAYESSCGVRLVTPTGQEITAQRGTRSCPAIGPVGRPTWSPDGAKIGIETRKGVYVAAADGTYLHFLSHQTSTAWYGSQPGRPSWRPRP